MLGIYKYIFEKVSFLYTKWGEKKISYVYGLCFICLLQFLNFFTLVLLLILSHVLNQDVLNKYYFYIFFLLLYVFNYFFIKNISIDTKDAKVLAKVSLGYIILTILSFCIIFILYLKS